MRKHGGCQRHDVHGTDGEDDGSSLLADRNRAADAPTSVPPPREKTVALQWWRRWHAGHAPGRNSCPRRTNFDTCCRRRRSQGRILGRLRPPAALKLRRRRPVALPGGLSSDPFHARPGQQRSNNLGVVLRARPTGPAEAELLLSASALLRSRPPWLSSQAILFVADDAGRTSRTSAKARGRPFEMRSTIAP
jgi:hypothetical protein